MIRVWFRVVASLALPRITRINGCKTTYLNSDPLANAILTGVLATEGDR